MAVEEVVSVIVVAAGRGFTTSFSTGEVLET
jgi:hypothetical protein